MSYKVAVSASEYQGQYMVMGDKLFRRVYNNNGSALEYGDPVCYEGGYSEYVKDPATATLPDFAGVVADADDYDNTGYTIADGAWGTILIHGEAAAVNTDGSANAIAAGASLKCENASSEMVVDQAAGTEPTYGSTAIALEACTTSVTLIKAFIKARG